MHEQAFHTCCRVGVSGRAGFQFNARSSGLSGEQLDELERTVVGYHAPPDYPPEPSEEQVGSFPAALAYRRVDGVGPVVTRTVYVGREYRAGGGLGSGRFGNYFSHIVVGLAGAEPFDGLLPIELAGAPHWTDQESDRADIPALGNLVPGGVTLEAALRVLGPRRASYVETVMEGVIESLEGGRRLVIVDEPGRVPDAWIAVVSFTIPRAKAWDMTFSTYEGRPRLASDRLCLTVRGTDAAVASGGWDGQVNVVDLTSSLDAVVGTSCLVRAIGGLASDPSALVEATSVMSGGSPPASLDAYGVELALVSGHAELIGGTDVPEALTVVAGLLRAPVADEAMSRVAACLSDVRVSAEVPTHVGDWADLYEVAESLSGAFAETVASVCLSALAEHAALLTDRPPRSASLHPPRLPIAAAWVGNLAPLSSQHELRRTISGGVWLGLLGQHPEVDRTLAKLFVGQIAEPAVADVMVDLCGFGGGSDAFREEALASMLQAALDGDDAAFEVLARFPTSGEAEARLGTADVAAPILLALKARRDPSRMAEYLRGLLLGPSDWRSAERLRRFFPPGAGLSLAQVGQLVEVHAQLGLEVDKSILSLVERVLSQVPLPPPSGDEAAGVVRCLRATNAASFASASLPNLAIVELSLRLPERADRDSLERWVTELVSLARVTGDVVASRWGEMLWLACSSVMRSPEVAVQRDVLRRLRGVFGDRVMAVYGQVLERYASQPAATSGVAIAWVFSVWSAGPSEAMSRLVLDRLLPAAIGGWSRSRRRGSERYMGSDASHVAWEEWCTAHPAPSLLARLALRGGGQRG